jgi:hypothetical protein
MEQVDRHGLLAGTCVPPLNLDGLQLLRGPVDGFSCVRAWRGVPSAIAVVVATAAMAYAVGSSNTKTKTVVRTVPVAAPASAKAAAPSCVLGAAQGSCNIDEAKAVAIPDKPLDVATRALLAQQLVEARTAALRYPTVADAVRAHMIQAGQFSPETGAHFINVSAVGSFDPASPASYIYDK